MFIDLNWNRIFLVKEGIGSKHVLLDAPNF